MKEEVRAAPPKSELKQEQRTPPPRRAMAEEVGCTPKAVPTDAEEEKQDDEHIPLTILNRRESIQEQCMELSNRICKGKNGLGKRLHSCIDQLDDLFEVRPNVEVDLNSLVEQVDLIIKGLEVLHKRADDDHKDKLPALLEEVSKYKPQAAELAKQIHHANDAVEKRLFKKRTENKQPGSKLNGRKTRLSDTL